MMVDKANRKTQIVTMKLPNRPILSNPFWNAKAVNAELF